MTLRELVKEEPSVRWAVRWGSNGRKYVYDIPKLKNNANAWNYIVEQVCDDTVWLWR